MKELATAAPSIDDIRAPPCGCAARSSRRRASNRARSRRSAAATSSSSSRTCSSPPRSRSAARFNKMAQLTDAERAAGVLAVSAGNHAQGVAYHAQRLGIAATIVMPRFALVGEGREHAQLRRRGGAATATPSTTPASSASSSPRERGLDIVHPYDDRGVIAGQGTVAPRDAGAAAGARHAGGGDRRRRPDRRHGHRGPGDEARHRSRRRADRALPGGLERHARRSTASARQRRSPTASPSSRPAR